MQAAVVLPPSSVGSYALSSSVVTGLSLGIVIGFVVLAGAAVVFWRAVLKRRELRVLTRGGVSGGTPNWVASPLGSITK